MNDKELLLTDLLSRIPYNVKVHYEVHEDSELGDLIESGDAILNKYNDGYFILDGYVVYPSQIKPYLRPMSSMTKEERNEYHSYCDYYYGKYFDTVESIDYLNKKMFAYRTIDGKDMFELGLAIEAPKDMYKFE